MVHAQQPEHPIDLKFTPRKVVYAIALPHGRQLTAGTLFTFTQVALYRTVRRLRSENVDVEVVPIPTGDQRCDSSYSGECYGRPGSNSVTPAGPPWLMDDWPLGYPVDRRSDAMRVRAARSHVGDLVPRREREQGRRNRIGLIATSDVTQKSPKRETWGRSARSRPARR